MDSSLSVGSEKSECNFTCFRNFYGVGIDCKCVSKEKQLKYKIMTCWLNHKSWWKFYLSCMIYISGMLKWSTFSAQVVNSMLLNTNNLGAMGWIK